MATSSIFAGFEEVALPEGAREIVFGVNVLQEQAAVKTVETVGTVAELVAKYREQLGLPVEVVVFVDGVKLSDYDAIPENASRIEIVKPAGKKGSSISLDDDDACKIVIVREDTIEYTIQRTFEKGKISPSLENCLDPELGYVVLSRGRQYLTVGFYWDEVMATRRTLLPVSVMTRRTQGGFAESGQLTINTVLAGMSESPVHVELNGSSFVVCRELHAGDELLIVLPGTTARADFNEWAADQRQNADGAVQAAHIEREAAIEKRTAELIAMDWAEIRISASKANIKASGPGRNADAVRADILRAEFPVVDEQAVYNAYLADNAPELLAPAEPETNAPGEPDEEEESA